MLGMFTLRLDKSLRVACGAGLLWLLVVQEKLCPWLLTPPDQPKPAIASGSAAHPQPAHDKRAKPRLPHIVPDTPLSRWPAGWFHHTLRQIAGDRDGVVSCGPQNPSTTERPPAAGADLPTWHRFQCLSEAVGSVLHATPLAGVDRAVRTCISRTGPPHVS